MNFNVNKVVLTIVITSVFLVNTQVSANQYSQNKHCKILSYMSNIMYDSLEKGGDFNTKYVENIANNYDDQGGNGAGKIVRQFTIAAREKNVDKEVLLEAIYFLCVTGRTIDMDRLPLCNRSPEGMIPSCLELHF